MDEVFEFEAIITYEKYYNEDNCWGSYNFITEDNIPYYDNKTCDGKFTCCLSGKMQNLQIGGKYLVKATYKKHPRYGHQYTPDSIFAIIPKTTEEQHILLQSIISDRIATNLINAYPNIVEDVVNGKINDIDYSKVSGIGKLTWKKIKDKILENYIISDIIIALKPLGVTFQMIKTLLKAEPNPSLLKQQLQQNPYIVCKIKGIGFKKADQFALQMKPELLNSTERLVAFVNYYLTELGESEGHTWISLGVLKNAISNNVSECVDKFEWLISNQTFLHIENERVGLTRYYQTEQNIFNYFNKKITQKVNFNLFDDEIDLSDDEIDNAIKQAEQEQGYKYTEEQLSVINKTLRSDVSFITGVAGSGKSSIMRAVLKAYSNTHKPMSSCALSAMAAQRIEEASGYTASTIHRLLGYQGLNSFLYNKDNHLISQVVLLDEASMVNASLFWSLISAIGDNTRIVICGDYKQLPPIGYGNVFSDLLEKLNSKYVHKLTKPMRQALKSGILNDANLIRNNRNPIIESIQPQLVHGELKDMTYVFRDNREQLQKIAINTFLKTVEKVGIENIAIVVPRKQGCANSTKEINKIIQDKLLPDNSSYIEYGENIFKLNARVMQTVNDYDKNVFNGEIGTIVSIGTHCNENGKKTPCCEVEYESNLNHVKKRITYEKKELDQLDLAYAVTTHKIQGGSRQAIIAIIDNTHYKLLDNCMLYTMLTRAKKKCLLLAEPSAFAKCIKTSHNARNTWIK